MTPLTFSKVITDADIDKLKEITIDLELLVCKGNISLIRGKIMKEEIL